MNSNNKLMIIFVLLLFCFPIFADSEILRPDGDGSTSALTPVGCTNNYECVDESSPDDDSTYVRTSAVQIYQYDLYSLPSFSGGVSDTIDYVAVHYRVRCESTGASVCKFKSYIRTNSNNYEGTEQLSTGANYINYLQNYTTNPNTGVAWTISEVNSLEAGIGLNGFLDSDGNRARGTQVYVTVGFTPAQEPVITFVSPTPDNDTYINYNWTMINITTDITSDVAILELNGTTNYTMSGSGTNFYYNVTDLQDCETYTYKVYANSSDSGLFGESEERIVKISIQEPAINWDTPSTNDIVYEDEFYINATVLNCNLSVVNVTITNSDDDLVYFKSVSSISSPTYNVYELTNFTQTQIQQENMTIEICSENAGGLTGCDQRNFTYDTNYSSPEYTDEVFDFFSLSSSTYVTIINETFNQSVSNTATIRSSFYIEKLDKPSEEADIYVRYIMNGYTLCDEVVVTVSQRFIRSATTCISENITKVGENNLVIQIRRTGTSLLNIYKWNLNLENGETNLGGDFRRDVNIGSGNFNSLTYIQIANFTTEKRTHSTTSIDSSFTLTPTDPTTVECFATNGLQNTTKIRRTTIDVLESMSIGGALKTSIPTNTSETWEIYCKQDDITTIFFDYEIYTQDDIDDTGRIMHSEFFRNQSITPDTPLTINFGKTKIMEISDYEIKGSKGISIIVSTNFESLSGSQDLNVSLEVSNGSIIHTDYHIRGFSLTFEDSNIKFYSSVMNLSKGDILNITVYANVDIGESVDLISSSLYAKDVSEMNIEASNVAPIVFITYPEDASIQWYNNQDVNYSAVDPNDNLDYCNITLGDTVVQSYLTGNGKINYTDFVFDTYDLNVTCVDDLGLIGLDSIEIILYCQEQWNRQITACEGYRQTIFYTDSNMCGTNTTLPADNGTTQSCTDINMDIVSSFRTEDLIIGKQYSYLANLYLVNTTTAVSNALCNYIVIGNESLNNSYILGTYHHTSGGDGLLHFDYNTNSWQKITDYDLIGHKGFMRVDCRCRNDCNDTSEEGCCFLNNGTLVTDYLYESETIEFNFIGDESVFEFENISFVLALGIFIFIMLVIYFILEDKHFILKFILIIFSFIGLFLMSSINMNNNLGLTYSFLKLGKWALYIFFIYTLVYLVYEILKWKNIIGGNCE